MAHQHSVQKLTNYDKLSFRFPESVVIVTVRLFVHWLVLQRVYLLEKKSGMCFIIAALLCLTFNELQPLAVYSISHY